MEGLGEFLRKGRQRASLSLEDLSKRTCIRLENLQSMEREDLDSLPSDAYVRGFVRQVCRELNLPPQDGIVRYEMLRASSGPPDEIEWAEDRAEDTAGRLEKALEDPERVVRIARKGGRWAGLGVAAMIGIVVLVFVWKALRSEPSGEANASRQVAAAEPGTVESAPARQQVPKRVEPPAESAKPAAPARKKTPAPPPERKPEVSATPSGNDESAPRTTIRADTGAFPAVLPDLEPAATPSGEGQKAGEPTTGSRSESESAAPTTRVETTSQPAQDDRVVLEVEAVRAVDVTVLLDGAGAPRRASLLSGERRRWKAEQHFVLTASDGGAVRLTMNGRDLGLAGSSGNEVIRTLRGDSR